ncbi:MAG: DNA mismatch repair endonuclease MutL [Candidatus Omnitrophica bacterium]|nr:DNA mismatch repair endonuclease MutL [Candidatus Omnitrophota bacterium]
MSKVHVLPADVISKIAAGEVVERPASVVKELLENSLDAGAKRIELHLKEGGKSLVHIKDDGSGIARDDLDALFTRHATSKVAAASDLEAILSLGFRGEALYSVGSVAEVALRSRAQGSAEAWEIAVKGGEKARPVPATMPSHGTDIRVGEIFFNTPARKKFLKSDAAEFEQILNVVIPYALLYPERAFLVTHNGRTVLDLGVAASPAGRAAEALGLESRHIIAPKPIEDSVCQLRMLLGDINIQRPRRDLQYLFINGRPVQSRNLSFHLNEVYKLIFPPAVHPFFAVMLTVPAGDVDVNVHPTKREVRLRDESRLAGFLRRVVEQALMSGTSAREVTADRPEAFSLTSAAPGAADGRAEGVPAAKLVFAPNQRSVVPVFIASDESVRPAVVNDLTTLATPSEQLTAPFITETSVTLKDRLATARLVGTFVRKYHLFESGESLFVVDQHAAQERILFEKFRRQIHAGKVEVQHLLTPLVMNVTPQEMLSWENSGERLSSFGFEVEQFGPAALALRAHPAVMPNPQQALRVLLAEGELTRIDVDVLASRACRASVMAGDKMDAAQAAHQLQALLACDDPYTCPHGRPVFIELKSSFLDRQFLRT